PRGEANDKDKSPPGVRAVLIVRLKQCEHALADGRLDAAYGLARASDLRADRRGQELIDRLAVAFAAPGVDHVRAGRFPQATADCDGAAALAGNTVEVCALRESIQSAVNQAIDAKRFQAQRIDAARRHIDQGQLTLGAQLLAPVNDDRRADALQDNLAAQRA